jgi:ankyrin repeat protein
MRPWSFSIAVARVSAALLVCSAGLAAFPANAAVSAEKQSAIERLEALGLTTAGPEFIRVVAASHQPAIDLFFSAGVDVNTVDEHGRTALLTAIRVSDWPMAQRLLKSGADVSRADEDGLTPLMAAVVNAHLPTIDELLKRGAPLNALDHRGHSALHYAVAARKHAVIDRLISAGTPSAEPCCDGNDLLTHALETRDPKIVAAILPHTPPLPRWTAATCEALATALQARDYKLASLFISKHTAPPVPTAGAQPYIAYAIARGDLPLLQALLDCGASPNAILNASGDEAFRTLVAGNFVRFYVEKEPGFTPLMLASALKRADFVKLLLDRGAVRTQYTTGQSKLLALYFAAWADCPEAVQLLVGGKPPRREELRVEVDLGSQRATLLKLGVPIFSTDISSGTSDKPTPIGEYVVTDKKRHHRSSIYPADMPYFMRLSCKDFGMHQGYVTGRPASHGCIRLPASAAKKLFAEVPIGTWVSVFR